MSIRTWWSLMPTQPIETEAELMQLAAWLWEVEDALEEALLQMGYDWPKLSQKLSQKLAIYGTSVVEIIE